MTHRRPVLAGLALLLLSAVACEESGDQGPVDQAPDACLELMIYAGLQWKEEGVLLVNFGVDPLCTGDDVTRRHNLDARWDYEADGVWDTDWVDLEFLECVVPDPPPTDVWRVRMEARDEAGNTAVAEAAMELPDFLPRYPDLGMSPIRPVWTIVDDGQGARIEEFRVWSVVWGWRVDEISEVQCELYVDDALVHQGSTVPFRVFHENCGRGTCFPAFGHGIEDLLTPGTHEITIVIDAPGLVDEGDEENNSQSLTIEIGADGLPVRPPADP